MFKLNQRLWFTDTVGNKKYVKIWRGRVCFINKYYMTLKTKHYQESFMIKDFNIGRYMFNE